MIKKIIPIILCLMLVFSVSVMATNTSDNANSDAPAVSEEMPMPGVERQGGGRGNMGTPPYGNIPNGEMPEDFIPPELPQGEFLQDMIPSKDNDGTKTEKSKEVTSENNGFNRGEKRPYNMPGGMQNGTIQNEENKSEDSSVAKITEFLKTYQTPIISVIMLALAFIFVICYKKKQY